MVRFVKNTEDILMDLQAEEDFTTQAWQECLEVMKVFGEGRFSQVGAFAAGRYLLITGLGGKVAKCMLADSARFKRQGLQAQTFA
jgi:hypothetical protein